MTPEWNERAACLDMDPDVFFPTDTAGVVAAKRICAGCPVRVECLEWALEHGERWGVWGGASERERRRMWARRARAAGGLVRRCSECPNEFVAVHGRQLVCGPDCAQARINARQKRRRGGAA